MLSYLLRHMASLMIKYFRVGLDFVRQELIGSLDFCHLFIMSDKLRDERNCCFSFRCTRHQRRKGS